MSSLAVFVPGAAPTARRSARLRCRASGDASGSAAASVRVFTGGSREARLGATQNMLALLETRGALDDAAIEASVEELSGMNPTPEPARAPELFGTWRLAWSKQAGSANPFQRLFGALAEDNFQILTSDGRLENLVNLGPLTVSARAPVKAVSETRVEVAISTIDVSLFGATLRTIEMTPKPGRGAGYVDQLFLDDDIRISRGNKGSLFVHLREKEDDAPGKGAEGVASGGEDKPSTALAVAPKSDEGGDEE